MDKPTAGVGAAQKIEKQARQLAYDTRYKVKQSMKAAPGSKLNPAQVAKAYLAQLAKSSAAPAVKARAKQMLTGNVKEEVMNSVDPKDMATDAVASALYKVFVEKKEDNLEEQIAELKEAYSKVNKKGERIYHVIVKDKKTGNTYTRDATREKIAELRANPNIASVEMSERRLDSDKEKSKGANTAAVKAGKGLDPVGQEDGDIDNDGDKDKSDKYLLNRRQARGAAIAKRKGVAEEFLGEVNTEKSNPDANGKKIDVMKGENKVVIAPEVPGSGKQSSTFMQVAHYDMQGNPLSESEMKLSKMIQEKTLTAAEKAKKEEIVNSLKPKYGKTSKTYAIATSVAKRVAEETVAQADKKAKKEQDEPDPRSIPTAVNLAKNKLRAMGLKCSYEAEGNQLSEEPGDGYIGPARLGIKNPMASDATRASADQKRKQQAAAAVKSGQRPTLGGAGSYANQFDAIRSELKQSYEPEGESIDERTAFAKRTGMSATRPGKPSIEGGAKDDKAYTSVKKTIRGMEGTPAGQRKKVPGKKPPAAGEYGAPASPAQKVAKRRADAQRSQEMQNDTRGT